MPFTAVHTARQRRCSRTQLDLDLSEPTNLVLCSCCGAPVGPRPGDLCEGLADTRSRLAT